MRKEVKGLQIGRNENLGAKKPIWAAIEIQNVIRINFHEITLFVNWCKMNHLVLNIDKTKEMVIDFLKTIIPPNKIVINDKEVAHVGDFKYLGVILDNKLSWGHNTDHCIKKIKPRMYCLRKLKSFLRK